MTMGHPMSDQDEGFARRWSRLKQQAREDQPPEEAPSPDLAVPATDTPPPQAGDKPEEQPFDPERLPPVESLTKDSDYSVFMRPEVPEDLRQRALRRLWAADAILSAPDPLDMHNIDYNAVPTFPDGFKSLVDAGEELLGGESPSVQDDGGEAKAKTDGRKQNDTAQPDEAGRQTQPPDAAAQQEDATDIKESGNNSA